MYPASREPGLKVAVTGPTGTFGQALMPLLEAEPRISRVIGVARRPFDPRSRGWRKLEYRQGDVRSREDLRAAFEGADAVIHLAFAITGAAGARESHRINVDGTLNALRAAAEAGASRFVYASSIAAYGFHRDNPPWMDEDWPARPADHLFYAREKAEVERLIAGESAALELDVYVLRPPIVLGPNMVGAKGAGLELIESIARATKRTIARLPLSPPAAVPALPIQLVHEEDVASALLLCSLGEGPPGTYNIAAEDTITLVEAARELGIAAVGIPAQVIAPIARTLAGLPGLPPSLRWIEALSHPSVMDVNRAKRELGWAPRYTALETLRQSIS